MSGTSSALARPTASSTVTSLRRRPCSSRRPVSMLAITDSLSWCEPVALLASASRRALQPFRRRNSFTRRATVSLAVSLDPRCSVISTEYGACLTEHKRGCTLLHDRVLTRRDDVPEMLTPAEAAEYVRYPEETLRRWRSLGIGPMFVKAGRHVRYRKVSLDRWLEEREREATARAR
jgi:excisionase family DNA binding protein